MNLAERENKILDGVRGLEEIHIHTDRQTDRERERERERDIVGH